MAFMHVELKYSTQYIHCFIFVILELFCAREVGVSTPTGACLGQAGWESVSTEEHVWDTRGESQ